jgi:hypothetical protein
VAIANVANHPGESGREDYRQAITRVRANGGRVVGYVHTTYTRRPAADVIADIDRWAAFYPLDGIFVDEMTNDGTAASLGYYGGLFQHVQARQPGWMVVGNPGTATRESYLTTPTADVLVTFENRTGYASHVPDPDAAPFAGGVRHLCYEVAASRR